MIGILERERGGKKMAKLLLWPGRPVFLHVDIYT
jgi:hypothetical protein